MGSTDTPCPPGPPPQFSPSAQSGHENNIHLRGSQGTRRVDTSSSPPGSGAWAETQGPPGVLSAWPSLFVFEHSALAAQGSRNTRRLSVLPPHTSTLCTAASRPCTAWAWPAVLRGCPEALHVHSPAAHPNPAELIGPRDQLAPLAWGKGEGLGEGQSPQT